jgi:hypothetical protein
VTNRRRLRDHREEGRAAPSPHGTIARLWPELAGEPLGWVLAAERRRDDIGDPGDRVRLPTLVWPRR